jgi:hypothetical protein
MSRSFALLPILLAATVPSPAFAQDGAGDALRSLDNPERVEAMASALEGITAAMMAMPVGPIVEAVRRADPDGYYDGGNDIPEDATLGELTRSDPDMAERVGEEARITGEVAGAAARDLATALPMLTAIASDLAAQWQQRLADARRNRR